MRIPMYVEAKKDIVRLLKESGSPLTVGEIYQALKEQYTIANIRKAVYSGVLSLENERTLVIGMVAGSPKCSLVSRRIA